MSIVIKVFEDGDTLYAKDLNTICDKVNYLESELKKIKDMLLEKLTPSEEVTGKLYDVGRKRGYGNFSSKYAIFDAAPGTYYITGRSGDPGSRYACAACYDAEGTLLTSFGTDTDTTYDDVEITAPANTTKIVVNGASSEDGETVVEGVAELRKRKG